MIHSTCSPLLARAAIPWSEANADAFAGTHEKFVLIIYDEANAVADIIWETTEGALTTAGAIWIAFGNHTKNQGRFNDCFAGRMRERWLRFQIDSRTAKKANQAQIAQWIEDYGEDSDFVRIRVRGIASPDSGDAYAMTFAVAVRPARHRLADDEPRRFMPFVREPRRPNNSWLGV